MRVPVSYTHLDVYKRQLHQLPIIHQQGAALSGNDVLGLMEAVAPQMADGTASAPPVTGAYALGGVFNHVQMVPPGNLHNRIHLSLIHIFPFHPPVRSVHRGILLSGAAHHRDGGS